jgi:hypothetical protein
VNQANEIGRIDTAGAIWTALEFGALARVTAP